MKANNILFLYLTPQGFNNYTVSFYEGSPRPDTSIKYSTPNGIRIQ
jgi:hypothetical protein